MKVSVIIINYNTFTLTCDCIRSIFQYTRNIEYEIILVDNASTERNPNDFLVEFPAIYLIKSNINGGFAYGNNLGISQASGDYILLLNSDTELIENSIKKCIDYLESNNNIGVLGCRMIYQDGNVQYTARRFRSISWELLDLFRLIPYFMPYKKRSRLMLGRYFRHDEPVFCDWVNGAFFMFRKNILEKLPSKKLDERFFMYGEDQLWCYQIKESGFLILFYSETTIVHISSGSTEIGKQIQLRKTMLKNELAIMKLRKGDTFYYHFFSVFYRFIESSRNLVKKITYLIIGKTIR